MAELRLYADQTWESPWAFHAMVALEELGVPYTLDPIRRPIAKDIGDRFRERALIGKVPCLVDGDFSYFVLQRQHALFGGVPEGLCPLIRHRNGPRHLAPVAHRHGRSPPSFLGCQSITQGALSSALLPSGQWAPPYSGSAASVVCSWLSAGTGGATPGERRDRKGEI